VRQKWDFSDLTAGFKHDACAGRSRLAAARRWPFCPGKKAFRLALTLLQRQPLRGLTPRSAVKQQEIKEANSMLNRLNSKRGGFTLVEIMIVVAIIALLAAIAVPGFLRARKRSQASRILNDLRLIDSAVDQYAIETNRATNFVVGTADWTNYLKKGSVLYNTGKDILGNSYGGQTVDILPSVPPASYTALSDVAGLGFWSPYGP
jgi:prepilin-type N-terminal cleavage/methylation domain-containing protein